MQDQLNVKFIENSNPREPETEGERYLKHKILNAAIFDGWTLYEQPVINSMHPDFILLHPNKGIIIIEVKDWHLCSPQYKENGQVLDNNKNYINRNPIDQVASYKELILKYELNFYVDANERLNSNAFSLINSVVYFHEADREKALKFCGESNLNRALVWSRDDLDYLCSRVISRDKRFPTCLFYRRSKYATYPDDTMQKLVENLERVLRPSDYARERKNPLILTREQKELVALKSGSIRRWGGVAGSGKTVIIASKAVEALKQNKRVLILTFNITLRHYIRDLSSQQFGDGDRTLLKNHLTIAHFHGFLSILKAELNISIEPKNRSIEEYTDLLMIKILEQINSSHPNDLKYDYILIDEGQDFNGHWIRFLKRFFTYDGELLVMYDRAQNIYETQGEWITTPSEIQGIGFRGQVGHLSVTHRLPESIIYQVQRLNPFFENENELTVANTQGDLFTKIEWKNISNPDHQIDYIERRINDIINEGISTIEDVVIITMQETTGVNVVNRFKGNNYKVSHVYDLSGNGDIEERRNEKWKFQPGTGRLKVCSYHSYKGWESSHVILLLEKINGNADHLSDVKKALFIALTRVSAFSDSRSFTCINKEPEYNSIGNFF